MITRNLALMSLQLLFYPLNRSFKLNYYSSFVDIFKSVDNVLDYNHYYPNRLHGHAWTFGHLVSITKFASYTGSLKNLFLQAAMVSSSRLFQGTNSESKFVVMSNSMKKGYIDLGVSSENILVVGPFILYADEYYNKHKTSLVKEKLGRTLLIIFPHTRKGEESIFRKSGYFTLENYEKSIEEVSSGYDTIVGVFHYYDIRCNFRVELEKKGVKTVTAGHPKDPLFLSRLRTIISLADHSLSYNISTHVGYCVAMGLSHEVIEIKPGVNKYSMFLNKEIYPTLDINNSDEKMLAEASLLFKTTGNSTSKEQYDFLDEYFGLGELKNPDEILAFLNK